MAAAPAFYFVRRRKKSLLGESVTLPDRRKIDAPLLLGAGIFGIGWGLAGICPGPGIVLLASRTRVAALFVLAVCAGMLISQLVARVLRNS